ncbi:MAG TPA: DUF6543 domain-containing protein [Pseudomonas sp.]|uniref:dermonecrotic toxin domain-containing protein n=1 Tax=Pseudomonas sp. TaxID=306 RepID=UPI002ED84906
MQMPSPLAASSTAQSLFQNVVDASYQAVEQLAQLPMPSAVIYESLQRALCQSVVDSQLNLRTALISAGTEEASVQNVLDLVVERIAGTRSPTRGRMLYASSAAMQADMPYAGISVLQIIMAADHAGEQLMRQYPLRLDQCWCSSDEYSDIVLSIRLALSLGPLLLAQARLLYHDGLLRAEDLAMVERVVRHPSGFRRKDASFSVCSITLDSSDPGSRLIEFVGAFIIAERAPRSRFAIDDDAGRILLFTLNDGLQAFASLEALGVYLRAALLTDSLEHWVELKEQASALHALEDDESAWRFESINGSVFNACVDGLATKQYRDVAHAMQGEKNADWLQNVEQASRLAGSFECQAFLARRTADLIKSMQPAWLRALPAAQQHELSALGSEFITRQHQHRTVMADLLELFTFARQRLDAELSARTGRAVDSTQVFVSEPGVAGRDEGATPMIVAGARRIKSVPFLPAGVPWLIYSAATSGRDKIPILDKSLTNISLLDVDYWLTALIVDGSGKVIPDISPAMVKAVIRELDVGNAYKALLSATLNDSKKEERRQTYNAMFLARINAQLLRARLSGELTDEQLKVLEGALGKTEQLTRLPMSTTSAVSVRHLCLPVRFSTVRVPGLY